MRSERISRTSAIISSTGCVLVLGAVLVGACAREEGGVPFERIDSAGVSITFSGEPTWAPGEGWRIDSTPMVDLGGGEGENGTLFGDLSEALLLPDGSIVAGDRFDGTLRFFAADGTLERVVGSKGEGPGEYESLQRVRLAGDSILVFDSDLGRVSVLDDEGRFGRSFLVGADDSIGLRAQPDGRWRDGRFLFSERSGVSTGMPVGPVRETVTAFVFQPDGVGRSVVGRWPAREIIVLNSDRSIYWLQDLPYARTTTIRTVADGFWVGTGDAPELDHYTPEGRLTRRLRWNAAPVPVEGAEARSWRASYDSVLPELSPDLRKTLEDGLKEAELPEYRPAFQHFLVSTEGDLWAERLARWDRADDARVWDVFSSDGRWLGPTSIPARVALMEIAGDRVLTRWRDSLDVQHLRVYRLRR